MDIVALLQIFKAIPWGALLVRGESATPPPSAPRQPPAASVAGAVQVRPGCQVAETCLLVYGYLEELGEGSGGYGVLGRGRDQLQEAALIARSIGKDDLAEQMLTVADRMPQVHTPAAAAELALELKQVKRQAWRLGRACGLAHR